MPLHTLFYLILSGIKRNHFKLVLLMNVLEDNVLVQSSDQTAFSIKGSKKKWNMKLHQLVNLMQ